jgi:hypothetical protein
MVPGWGVGVETVTAAGESDMIIQEFNETEVDYNLIIYTIREDALQLCRHQTLHKLHESATFAVAGIQSEIEFMHHKSKPISVPTAR